MKKIISIFIIYCGLFVSSCTLDTVPVDFIASEYYFSNEEQCTLALTGVYDRMDYNYATNLCTLFDTADEMWAFGTIGPWVNSFYSSDTRISSFWKQMYEGIERANMLLDKIDDADMDDSRRMVIKGEAKFLRAYYYFMLVQNFGDVPFKTTATASASDLFYPRVSSDEIYDFIYDEMVEAEAMVAPITSYDYAEHASKSAVQGMLARVSLYMAGFPNNRTEKYADALKWSEKVIQQGFHTLNPDYSQVFINLIQDKYDTKESIWEIGFRTTGASDSYYEFGEMGNTNGIYQNILEYGAATGTFKVYGALWNKYDTLDTRRDWAIAPYDFVYNSNPPEKRYFDSTKATNSRYIGKYRREYELSANKQKRANGTNYPLLRYADVLLMAAEAENEVNGPSLKALGYLNQVRERAQAPLISDVASKDTFRKILQDERSLELCFEGLRKQDLKRWGILIPTMKDLAKYIRDTETNATIVTRATLPLDNVTEQHYYYPIPLREMNLNKLLTQNPGW
ncbi:putative outer membrane starch-binding protein [Dyadobacter jejuensis]|uniref:Putative outer membrane starch-binding protein n=1 Tax=Dyadobacter jejuensis TaxID=1082580 RepID=A0A316AK60_9BACT|nr:RagB/SusD family nutrient uptake outer membrane protein [Dyadobacter jejuensis]PWJ57748.1 putative outer membrane starch-binding protein [Dyadobacter jejuensis]